MAGMTVGKVTEILDALKRGGVEPSLGCSAGSMEYVVGAVEHGRDVAVLRYWQGHPGAGKVGGLTLSALLDELARLPADAPVIDEDGFPVVGVEAHQHAIHFCTGGQGDGA